MENLGDQEMDEDLADQIFTAMLTRLSDKVHTVRVQAIKALARLQDPDDKKCPVIKGIRVYPVKNTVKSRNSQMDFHLVEIFPRDVNCRKRHLSGSTLLAMGPARLVAKAQLLQLCYTSDYWARSMSTKWAQKRKQIPMNSLSLAYS